MKQYKYTLVELGCEELPAFNQHTLIADWHDNVVTQLNKHRITYAAIDAWCGPRRLSLLIKNLAIQGQAETIIKEGPAKQVAYDEDGMPTPACIGFARSCGVEPNQLVIKHTAKGERLCYETQQAGNRTTELLPQLLSKTLQPLCKGMHWPQSDIPFLRPVRWLVLMVDHKALDWQMFGLKSSNLTYGHRFLSTKPLIIDDARNYEKILRQNKVIANQHKRVKMVDSRAHKVAELHNAQLRLSPPLATEISGLVEQPTAYIGHFDRKFLQLPAEILDSVICGTQKYMMLTDHKGKHLPSFVFIANIPSKKPRQLISGNEAVIRPRLEDAVFFYRQDRKIDLAARFDTLAQVAFFSGLGNMQQKSLRCTELVSQLAQNLDLPQQPLAIAAQLCKCDLVSLMVQEFPHLQGIMGGYYYLNAKSRPNTTDKKCAAILSQHYLPKRAADPLPDSLEATCLSLADKLDSLAGLFATNHKPSGTGDPYGLRRNGLAIGRILVEKAIDLDIAQLLESTLGEYTKQGLLDINQHQETITIVIEFIKERMLSYGNEQGLDTETLNAAFGANEKPGNIYRYWLRAQALSQVTSTDLSKLIALNKRLRNILEQSKYSPGGVNIDHLKEKEEIMLHSSYIKLAKQIQQSEKQLDYTNYAQLLIELAEPLALFFDKVMVMAEDPAIRSNRLTLLNSIHSLFLGLANLTAFSLRE